MGCADPNLGTFSSHPQEWLSAGASAGCVPGGGSQQLPHHPHAGGRGELGA